jgi:hypothetical protein
MQHAFMKLPLSQFVIGKNPNSDERAVCDGRAVSQPVVVRRSVDAVSTMRRTSFIRWLLWLQLPKCAHVKQVKIYAH